MKLKHKIRNIFHIIRKKHLRKIFKGGVGAIPYAGPILAEYIPEENELSKTDLIELKKFIKYSKGNKGLEIWQSSDKQNYLYIKDRLCEQHGCVICINNHIYITLLYPFDDNNYYFSLEPSLYKVEIKEKTTTCVHIYSLNIKPGDKLRWMAKGLVEKK